MPCRPFAASLKCLIVLVPLLLAPPAWAQDAVVRLASLDWPPFSGPALSDKGAVTAVVRAAFAAIGRRVEVTFYPWNRAVAMTRAGRGADGYFPEYDSPDTRREFVLSVSLGSSPLGFAERTDTPIVWSTLDDLRGRRIGVVDGYTNTDEMDFRIAQGLLSVDSAGSDLINLKKLLGRRIDLAVIDRAVMNDLLRAVPELGTGRLRFNPRPLGDKTFHVAFRRNARGEVLAAQLAEGLGRIDAALLLRQALEN